MRFKKNPSIVDATQWRGEWVSVREWMESLTGSFAFPPGTSPPIYMDGKALMVKTDGEVIRVKDGEWIVRDVAGRFFRCDPGVFVRTYSPVEKS